MAMLLFSKWSNWDAIHRQVGRAEILRVKDRPRFQKNELKKEIKKEGGGSREGKLSHSSFIETGT